MKPIEAINEAFNQLVGSSGWVNIGMCADRAADLMGGNRRSNLLAIQAAFKDEWHLMPYTWSTHLMHSLFSKKRWPGGDYLQHGTKVSKAHYKLMALKTIYSEKGMNMKNTLREQVKQDFKEHLELFCYEFYEYLEGYEESSIEAIAGAVVEGIADFAAGIDRTVIEKELNDANDQLDPVPYEDDYAE